jgi:chemotaxis protein MotB
MASNKSRKKPEGAPEWVVTYGDMMSLLLTFFVLLVSMSTIEEEEKFQEALQSIREAFGYVGGIGKVPVPNAPTVSMIQQLESIVIPDKPKNRGDSAIEGVEGQNVRITKVREGIEIAVGGRIAFDRFSAELKPEALDVLEKLATKLKGHTTKIDIRGHTTAEPLPADSAFKDQDDLAYHRARAVADALESFGVEPVRLRITAVGAREPLVRQAYTEARRSLNRRVEIVVNESTTEQYEGEPLALQEPTDDGRG